MKESMEATGRFINHINDTDGTCQEYELPISQSLFKAIGVGEQVKTSGNSIEINSTINTFQNSYKQRQESVARETKLPLLPRILDQQNDSSNISDENHLEQPIIRQSYGNCDDYQNINNHELIQLECYETPKRRCQKTMAQQVSCTEDKVSHQQGSVKKSSQALTISSSLQHAVKKISDFEARKYFS